MNNLTGKVETRKLKKMLRKSVHQIEKNPYVCSLLLILYVFQENFKTTQRELKSLISPHFLVVQAFCNFQVPSSSNLSVI